MRIDEHTVTFDKIPVGTMFKFGEDYYLRIQDVITEFDDLNAVDLYSGEAVRIMDSYQVIAYPNATISL